jgi:Putative S-adenosyl-L-methionine-dependent methyltransferase
MLLLELNRLLRPGGYFVWSATPVYQKLPEDVEIWNGTNAKSLKISQQYLYIYQKLRMLGAEFWSKTNRWKQQQQQSL